MIRILARPLSSRSRTIRHAQLNQRREAVAPAQARDKVIRN
jgi:hypothetical protein